MGEKMGVTRRAFGLEVGAGIAAITTVGVPIASAKMISEVMGSTISDPAFESSLKQMHPVMRKDIAIDFGKNTATVYKLKKQGVRGDSFETNSMGVVIVQLCAGKLAFEQIHKVVADIYGIDYATSGQQVTSFVKYLFDSGYLTFSSGQYVPDEEKNRYSILNVLNDKTGDKFVKIYQTSKQ